MKKKLKLKKSVVSDKAADIVIPIGVSLVMLLFIGWLAYISQLVC